MRAPSYSETIGEFFSQASIEDPAPMYARLLATHPIARVGDTGVHFVANWALIDEALQREEDFSANLTGVLALGEDGLPTVLSLPRNGASRVIATADEPDHAVHRALVQSRLSLRRVEVAAEPVREWAGAAVERFVAAGGGDFVPLAEEIPARVVAWLLGLPIEDHQKHRRWAMMGGDILGGDTSSGVLERLAEESFEMATYLEAAFRAVQAAPSEDPAAPLLHALARGVAEGRIDEEEALGITTVLFGAGGESTAALVGSAVRHLAADSALASRLRAEPGLIPAFLEEVVRLDPPFKFHFRVVRRDTELGGVALREGDRLMLAWAAASRDPEEVEDPGTLRLDRSHPRHHMSFGRGAHFCVGAPLARLEARIVCEELLTRTSSIDFAPGQSPHHVPSIFVRRLASLPLAVVAS